MEVRVRQLPSRLTGSLKCLDLEYGDHRAMIILKTLPQLMDHQACGDKVVADETRIGRCIQAVRTPYLSLVACSGRAKVWGYIKGTMNEESEFA